MNTMPETKARLRLLSAALTTILDNYGINTAQVPNYNEQRQELEDIIANMADAAPPAPVTVEDVIEAVTAHIGDIENKIDALVALANSAGATPAPAVA